MAVVRLTEKDFQGTTLKKPGKWAVLFAAPWCPFCRSFRPHYLEAKVPAGVTLAEIIMQDYYEPVPLAFDIEVIPTVIAFKDGAWAWRHSGIPNRGLGPPTLHKLEGWT